MYVAYAEADNTLTVARRDYVTGEWTKATRLAPTLGESDPSHNQIALAVDGDGHLHVWYGMHNGEAMRYLRSNKPDSVKDGFTNRSSEFPVEPNNAYTYPDAVTAPNGDVYFSIRHANQYLPLYHWNNATNKWRKVAVFVDGSGLAVPYFPTLHVDRIGNVHIKWEWANEKAREERHQGSYACYKPGVNRFYRASGTPYTLPITTTSADVFQKRPSGVSWDNLGIALSDITVDANNQPIISYSFSPDGTRERWQHKIARWDGSKWVQVVLTDKTRQWNRNILVADKLLYCYARTNSGTEQWSSVDGQMWTAAGVLNGRALDGAVKLGDNEHVLLHLGTVNRGINSDLTLVQIS